MVNSHLCARFTARLQLLGLTGQGGKKWLEKSVSERSFRVVEQIFR